MRLRLFVALFFIPLCLCQTLFSAERMAAQGDPDRLPRLGLGINYLGAQLSYRFGRYMAEARWQTGQDGTGDAKITSSVVGMRGYRFFLPRERRRFYLGLEAAKAQATQETGTLKVEGFIGGSFLGVECDVSRRLSAGFDVGPYIFSLKEGQTAVTSTELDFVANTFVMFRFF